MLHDANFLFPLLSNRRDTINQHLWSLTLEQRLAFGLWYSEALSPSDISGGPPSLITDTGNLIAYLPFHIFQHLSPAQVSPPVRSDTCLGNPKQATLSVTLQMSHSSPTAASKKLLLFVT